MMNKFENNKELREKYLQRIEILEKVKVLNEGYANKELYTIEYLIGYFDCGKSVLDMIIKRNKEELSQNGMKLCKKDELIKMFLNSQSVSLKEEIKERGKTILKLNDGEIIIPNRGIILFNKRSILNLAMLFTKNEVAKEIRNMLLNNHEQLAQIYQETKEEKYNPNHYIDEELKIQNKIIKAVTNENWKELEILKGELLSLRKNRIEEQEEIINIKTIENNQLKEEIEELEEYKFLKNCLNNSNIEGISLGDLGTWLKSNTNLNIGRNKIFKFCKENKLVRKSDKDGNNYAMDISINNNWMRNQCEFKECLNGKTIVTNKIIVTKKGMLYLSKKLFERQLLKNLNSNK